jgi:hypothetical protein
MHWAIVSTMHNVQMLSHHVPRIPKDLLIRFEHCVGRPSANKHLRQSSCIENLQVEIFDEALLFFGRMFDPAPGSTRCMLLRMPAICPSE